MSSPPPPKPSFARHFMAVGGRTAIGQIIGTAAAPLLTRVYSPAMFGVFGAFSAVLLPLTNICCLKYDSAIVLERDDEAAQAVVAAGLIALIGVVVAFYAALAPLYLLLPAVRADPAANLLMLFAGPTILATGLFQIGLGIKTRASAFGDIGQSQIVRPATTATAQLALGLTAFATYGLLLGQLAGQLAGAARLLRRPGAVAVRRALAVPAAAMRGMAMRHRAFALYSTPQSIVSGLTVSSPMLLLAWLFDARAVGFYWLAYRILMLPSLVIAESLRSVFYRHAVTTHRDGGDLRRQLERATGLLLAIATPVLLVLFVAGPFLFGLVFGHHWETAGAYARLIALPWAITLAQVPANTLVPILGLQRDFLIQELLSLAVRCAALVVGARYGGDAMAAMAVYAIAASVVPMLWIVYVAIRARSVGAGQDGTV